MISIERVEEAIQSLFPSKSRPTEQVLSGASMDPDVRAFAMTLHSKSWNSVTVAQNHLKLRLNLAFMNFLNPTNLKSEIEHALRQAG